MAKVVPMEKKKRFLLPLSIVFFLFGVEICDYFSTCRFSKSLRFLRIFIIVILHLTMAPILLFNYFHLMQRIGGNDGGFMSVYIADLILVVISMGTYEFYLIRQKAIRQFIKTLSDLAYTSMLKRRLLVQVAVISCCILPFSTAPYGVISGRTNLNMEFNATHDFRSEFYHDIFWHFLWLCTFRSFALLSCAFFLFICFLFSSCFQDLDDSEPLKSVPKFLQRHQVLCGHLRRAEALFSSISFVACSSDVITTTFFLRSVSLGGDVATWKISLLPYALLNFSLFTNRIMAAAVVNSKVTASLEGMDFMVNKLLNSNSMNALMNLTKLTCYIQRLSINPPALTGGGFFTMNRGCILAVGSAILTYILVLYQSI